MAVVSVIHGDLGVLVQRGHTYSAAAQIPRNPLTGNLLLSPAEVRSRLVAEGFVNVSVREVAAGTHNMAGQATWMGADQDVDLPSQVISFRDITPAAAAPGAPAPVAQPGVPAPPPPPGAPAPPPPAAPRRRRAAAAAAPAAPAVSATNQAVRVIALVGGLVFGSRAILHVMGAP